jgi:hypothetical protein
VYPGPAKAAEQAAFGISATDALSESVRVHQIYIKVLDGFGNELLQVGHLSRLDDGRSHPNSALSAKPGAVHGISCT